MSRTARVRIYSRPPTIAALTHNYLTRGDASYHRLLTPSHARRSRPYSASPAAENAEEEDVPP